MLYECNSILERKVEMWVENLPNGKVRFVERYTDYMTGKIKKVSVVFDKDNRTTRKLALDALNKKINENNNRPKKEYTFKQLIDEYQKYQLQTVKMSTYTRNCHAAKSLMNILGEDTLINRLSAPYVTDRFLASGKAPGTLNEHLTRFKAIIRWAFQNDYIDDISFVQKINRFKDVSKKEKIKDKFLEPEELNTFLKQVESTGCWHWYYLTKFMVLSGLRLGEAAALDNKDIDLKNRVIHVAKTYDSINKIITTPKTSCSIREVFIQDELLTCIKQMIHYFKELKLLNGVRNDIFITGANGERVEMASYNKFLKENNYVVKNKRITSHVLRHTHASLLLAEGVSVDTISRRLGHENSKITKEIYLHITEKLKEQDNESIRKINLT